MTVCTPSNICKLKERYKVVTHVTNLTVEGLLYGLVDKCQGKEPKASYDYKNIGWDCWVKDLIGN
jgi:hypothetical protein